MEQKWINSASAWSFNTALCLPFLLLNTLLILVEFFKLQTFNVKKDNLLFPVYLYDDISPKYCVFVVTVKSILNTIACIV